MTILHTNGYHVLEVVFCDCGDAAHWKQLWRQEFFPATYSNPRTVFSFDALEHFHTLNLQGKTTPYDFYLGILQQTDSTIVWTRMQVRTVNLYIFGYIAYGMISEGSGNGGGQYGNGVTSKR